VNVEKIHATLTVTMFAADLTDYPVQNGRRSLTVLQARIRTIALASPISVVEPTKSGFDGRVCLEEDCGEI
jgi:hypothetical protein